MATVYEIGAAISPTLVAGLYAYVFNNVAVHSAFADFGREIPRRRPLLQARTHQEIWRAAPTQVSTFPPLGPPRQVAGDSFSSN